MEFSNERPSRRRIVVSPPGRGWRRRKEIVVNPEYVRGLLEQARITERDELLMRYLASTPVLSARQIHRLVWFDCSVSNMSRRLRELYDYHIVDRVRMVNKEEGIVYALGKAARIWLFSESRGGDGPRVNLKILDHDLSLAEVLVRLQEELRRAGDEHQLRLNLEWKGEAECRVLSSKSKVMLEPDALAILTGQGWGFSFYLEADRGTEGLAAFDGKVKRYLNTRRHIDLRVNGHLPGVFVTTTTGERAERLAELIAAQQYKIFTDHKKLPRQAQEVPPPLLTWFVVTLDDLKQHGFFGNEPIWYLVASGQEKAVKYRSLSPWDAWKQDHK